MKIDGINNIFINSMSLIESTPKPAISFDNWLTKELINTNNKLNAADDALIDLARGKTENLHQTMITLEEAKLSLQYIQQIRNRLQNAYQDLLKEQI